MAHLCDYLQATAFIFLLSFKPSEPHLSRYLTDVKHLTKDEVNNLVYPVYTYASLACMVLLAAAKVACPCALGDKTLILLGCGGRVATRLLLLYGDGLAAMQLMQLTYSLGTVAEFVFYAYVLNAVPADQSQRLTAITQAAYLVSHTAAGLLGDFLLAHSSIDLLGLMRISAASVCGAALVACTFRSVGAAAAPQAACLVACRAVYSARQFWKSTLWQFWKSTLWWMLNYSVYVTIYGYETSLYSEYQGRGEDHNGAIFAAGVLLGAAAVALLGLPLVEKAVSRFALPMFILLGAFMSVMVGVMGWDPTSEWALALSFMAFFAAWSIGNGSFYGETRRAVEVAVREGHGLGVQDTRTFGELLVSLVFLLNSAAGTLMQSFLTAICFTWLQLDIAAVFRWMALLQAATAVVIFLLSQVCNGVQGQLPGQPPLKRPESANLVHPGSGGDHDFTAIS